MRRLTLEPRTPAWHSARNECWTASAAATLCAKRNAMLLRDEAAKVGVPLDIAPLLDVGIEDFFENTLWRSWADKTGRIPRFEGNAHTERGTRNEVNVLNYFEEKNLFTVERDVTALHATHEGLLASFDAVAPPSTDPSVVAPHGFPVEAKCPAFMSRHKLWTAKKEGKLPILGLPYYWCQVQHQILVAEAPYGWFVAAGWEQNKDTGEFEVSFPIMHKVERDQRFLDAYEAAALFYHQHYLVDYNEPPKLPEDEVYLAQLAETAKLARALAENNDEFVVEAYFKLLEEEAALKDRKAALEAQLIAEARVRRPEGIDMVIMGGALEVQFTTSPGNVSWQKVAKKLAADAGMKELPETLLESCRAKEKEAVKLKAKEI